MELSTAEVTKVGIGEGEKKWSAVTSSSTTNQFGMTSHML